jgi:hypothetical protein
MSLVWRCAASEAEVSHESLIKSGHLLGRVLSDPISKAGEVKRANLFGLRFGV